MIVVFGALSAGAGLLVAMGQAVASYPLPGQILVGTVFGLSAASFVGQFFERD